MGGELRSNCQKAITACQCVEVHLVAVIFVFCEYGANAHFVGLTVFKFSEMRSYWDRSALNPRVMYFCRFEHATTKCSVVSFCQNTCFFRIATEKQVPYERTWTQWAANLQISCVKRATWEPLCVNSAGKLVLNVWKVNSRFVPKVFKERWEFSRSLFCARPHNG